MWRSFASKSPVQTKKIINNGDDAVDEMLEGILLAHGDTLRASEVSHRAIIACNGPREGKVGLVIGGGSGHEPTFVGFVGEGLADAAAIGNVFASPPPDPALACVNEVSGGAGVLFMYGNYAGDVMNFDLAAEMAAHVPAMPPPTTTRSPSPAAAADRPPTATPRCPGRPAGPCAGPY